MQTETTETSVKVKTSADVLRSAARAIEEFGWLTHASGNPEVGFCMMGAIMHVATRDAGDGGSEWREGITAEIVRAATEALYAATNDDAVGYNDTIATCSEDVTQLMYRVAEDIS